MDWNISLDYSKWNNPEVTKLARKADKDNVNGLQGEEVADFMRSSADSNISKSDLYNIMGLTLSKSRVASSAGIRQTNPDFDKAVDFYNNKMNPYQRYIVTNNTYTNLENRLYKMESEIDKAFVNCTAYGDIVIVPRWHYRYYPYFEDRLINFDIEDIRNRTTADMESLYELKDNVEYIIENANGETKHNPPPKTDYDVDKLAQKYLGMSYQEFAAKYKDELEFCKTVTYADLANMNETQRYVYSKAKAYAKEMLQITVNEAHNTNWDVGQRKVNETMRATGDMYTISEFEYDGITPRGLSEIQSGIMFKAFEEELVTNYHDLNPTSVDNVKEDNKITKPVKLFVNGKLMIFNPDGSVYNANGEKIK